MLTKKQSKKTNLNFKIFLTSLFLILFFSLFAFSTANGFLQSIHYEERLTDYCSTSPCPNKIRAYIHCDNAGENACADYFKGFRELYNINDPRIACYGQTSCDLPDDSDFSRSYTLEDIALLRAFYVPAGAKRAALMLYGLEPNTPYVVGTMFEKGEGCPSTYPSPESLPGTVPTIPQLMIKCGFSGNSEGMLRVTNTNYFPMIDYGGWFMFAGYGGNAYDTYSYVLTVNVGTYRKWYNCMNEQDGWDEDGDPKYGFTACDNLSTSPSPSPTISPTPTTSPTPNDCSINICKGNSCWDGKKYIAG
ncbi:MAG: hypothetical protein WCK16_01395, partial [Candidatus Moraniibacteriota bacterium]